MHIYIYIYQPKESVQCNVGTTVNNGQYGWTSGRMQVYINLLQMSSSNNEIPLKVYIIAATIIGLMLSSNGVPSSIHALNLWNVWTTFAL